MRNALFDIEISLLSVSWHRTASCHYGPSGGMSEHCLRKAYQAVLVRRVVKSPVTAITRLALLSCGDIELVGTPAAGVSTPTFLLGGFHHEEDGGALSASLNRYFSA
jgi:hypothetical protein